MDAADYVLARFRKEEMPQMELAITRSASAAELWSAEGIMAAMNRYNGDSGDEAATPAP